MTLIRDVKKTDSYLRIKGRKGASPRGDEEPSMGEG